MAEINSTEIAGLIAFVPASVAAALNALPGTRPGDRGKTSWLVISLIYAFLAVEVLARTRYVAFDQLRQALRHAGVYAERRGPQALALGILLIFTLLVGATLVRGASSVARAVARVALLASVMLFIGESVSLHAVDQILYAEVGPIRSIGWLWLACGLTGMIASLMAMREAGPSPPSRRARR